MATVQTQAEQDRDVVTHPTRSKGFRGYRMMYRLGITPWDQTTIPPELAELVEGPRALPPGRALDMGCGLGQHSLYLARAGWEVTGVDFVARAVEAARTRAEAAAVAVRFVEGDVTRLAEMGMGREYSLILDAGCLHGLDGVQRADYAEGVAAVALPDATLLLFAFAPAFRGPSPRGLSLQEILATFGDKWELQWHRADRAMRLPGPLRNANPSWYLFRRRPAA